MWRTQVLSDGLAPPQQGLGSPPQSYGRAVAPRTAGAPNAPDGAFHERLALHVANANTHHMPASWRGSISAT